MSVELLFFFFVAFVSVVAGSDLTCYDENNSPVAWWIIIKFPELSDASGDVKAGYAYSYLDANSYGSFKKGKTTLKSSSSGALGYTMSRLYSKMNAGGSSFGYGMYNDQPPDNYNDSSNRAHAKGVIAVDSANQGVWIMHSVPNFPHDPSFESSYFFPEEETTYGQTFLCMSLTGSSMENVADMLTYYMPNYYVKKIPSNLQSMYPTLYDAIMNDSHITSPSTMSTSFQFSSGLKSPIGNPIAFAKTKEWGQDFYDDLLAPELNSDLLVETWIRGSEIPPYCGTYTVYDIEEEERPGPDGSYTWTSTKDHSKWCITYTGANHHGSKWTCVSDINRMESQRKRGGGAVCFESSDLWNAFNDGVVDYETC